MEEATFLSKFASRVFIVHRRDELRASKVMQTRAISNPKLEFLYSHIVTNVQGDNEKLTNVTIKDLKSGLERNLMAGGLFFAIGHEPNTSFLNNRIATDDQGYIITKPGTTQTSQQGMFACGDVQDRKWRQAITAAGTGCMAALEAEHYLTTHFNIQ